LIDKIDQYNSIDRLILSIMVCNMTRRTAWMLMAGACFLFWGSVLWMIMWKQRRVRKKNCHLMVGNYLNSSGGSSNLW